jgi:hypothetical protein
MSKRIRIIQKSILDSGQSISKKYTGESITEKHTGQSIFYSGYRDKLAKATWSIFSFAALLTLP